MLLNYQCKCVFTELMTRRALLDLRHKKVGSCRLYLCSYSGTCKVFQYYYYWRKHVNRKCIVSRVKSEKYISVQLRILTPVFSIDVEKY